MLPQMVEARKREDSEISMDSPNSMGKGAYLSRSSTSSDFPSPITPTFSLRGHSRFPSSTSSIASSPNMRDSVDGFGSANRPLTDVTEEPHEKDEDYEMVDGVESELRESRGEFLALAFNTGRVGTDLDMTDSIAEGMPSRLSDYGWTVDYSGPLPSPTGYDLADDYSNVDFAPSPCAKRHRAEDCSLSPIQGLTSRFGSRMPSLSRKWRSRKGSSTATTPDRTQDSGLSRANSTRASSLASSIRDNGDPKSPPLPPTPTRKANDDSFEEPCLTPIDTDKANAYQDVVDLEAKPTTPLLPPIMTQIPDHIKEVPYQSPLQSPSVADPEPTSVLSSPLPTPRIAGLPSPPLSSKASVSSFHRQRGLAPVSPSSEIPPLLITDLDDHWADRLGHANFVITPGPYVADNPTLSAYKKMRSDWDDARCNYMKHLMRIGEHYGATSKIHRLTEEKWAEIDDTWKRNADLCLFRISGRVDDIALSICQNAIPVETVPMSKLPALNGPKSEGKFPKLGDEGIVGPMEKIASPIQQPQHNPKKRKVGFIRWVQGVWPASASVFARR